MVELSILSLLFVSKQSLLGKMLSILIGAVFSFYRILSSHLKLYICIYVKCFSCSSLLWLGSQRIHMIEIKISNVLVLPLFHYPHPLSFSYPIVLSPSDGVLICRWNVKSTKNGRVRQTRPLYIHSRMYNPLTQCSQQQKNVCILWTATIWPRLYSILEI